MHVDYETVLQNIFDKNCRYEPQSGTARSTVRVLTCELGGKNCLCKEIHVLRFSLQWLIRLCSSGFWHHLVLQADTDVLEECAPSVFSAEPCKERYRLNNIGTLQRSCHSDPYGKIRKSAPSRPMWTLGKKFQGRTILFGIERKWNGAESWFSHIILFPFCDIKYSMPLKRQFSHLLFPLGPILLPPPVGPSSHIPHDLPVQASLHTSALEVKATGFHPPLPSINSNLPPDYTASKPRRSESCNMPASWMRVTVWQYHCVGSMKLVRWPQ
jgi:hypothetical protein